MPCCGRWRCGRRPGGAPPDPPRRILCIRLERIGDLLMTAPALAELRALAPSATIDLVVGSWNRDLAAAIPGIDRVETLDAAWLARGGAGMSALGAGDARGALAIATLRSGDQLRARHQDEHRGRGRRRPPDRGVRQRRRRRRCSIWRSTTTCRRTPPTTRGALVHEAMGRAPDGPSARRCEFQRPTARRPPSGWPRSRAG